MITFSKAILLGAATACCALGALAAESKAKPAEADSGWTAIFTEPGRRMEIDRTSIKKDPDGKVQAWGRMIFDKPVPDAVSGGGYRVLEALNRYDCNARTFATLKRVYRKDEKTTLREEESGKKTELPVRTGTLDDKVLRVACKPSGSEVATAFNATVEKAKAAIEPRKELMRTELGGPKVEGASHAAADGGHAAAAKRPAKAAPKRPAPVERKDVPWSYEGEGGPEHWGTLKPEFSLCATGERQSPIDIRDTIRVDLPAILFQYKPAQFRILDTGKTIQVGVRDNRITLMGKEYELLNINFHKPSEERVEGKAYDMGVHLVHRSDDNKLAVVSVMLEKGTEHPVVQTLWNYLPLERNVDVYPPGVAIDLNQLLPEKKGYYTYMGSLAEPPCTEGVLWLVMKDPVQVSAEQISIFGRLYRHNARPVQPANGRLIKESR